MKLDKEAIENIKKYKFGTNESTTIEKYVFIPYWDAVVSILPEVIRIIY